MKLRPGPKSPQAPKHDADHGETDEGGDCSGIALESSSETTEAADPGDRSFEDGWYRMSHLRLHPENHLVSRIG